MSANFGSLTITVVGTTDRQLLQLLRSAGTRVASASIAELENLARSSAKAPDVLIVDVRDDKELPDSLAVFKRIHPDAGVVIVASSLDPELMLQAMRAGVNECVTDPLELTELEAAIGRVTSTRSVRSVSGQLFAFLGAKGGVGATTVAVNVATALSHGGKTRCLLIDLHVAYGDAAVFLGVEPKFSVIDALENTHRLDEAFFRGLVVPTKSGPDLLASSNHGLPWASDVKRIKRLIEFATQIYDYVVIDCPRSDAAALDALDAARYVVIVANQELATVRSASRMAGMLRQRYGGDRVMVVMSRYDSSSDIGQEDVERVVGTPVRHVFPSDYRLSIDALNRGRPLVLKNHNRLAGSLDDFARELVGTPKPDDRQTKPGFLSRITGRP